MIKNFENFLVESINDKIKLKVLLMGGSPLSGKSTIINMLSHIPFYNIDMDDYIKLFSNKKGLDLDMRPSAQNYDLKDEIRIKSRDLSIIRMKNAINSLLPIVIDGTGKDVIVTLKIKNIYEKWGYDVSMLYVDVDFETALKRNLNRERKIPEHIIKDINYKSKNNIRIYQNEFDKFWLFNTLIDDNKKFKKIESEIRHFFYSPVQNPIGQQILTDMKNKNLKYLNQLDSDVDNIDFFK